MGTEPTPRRRVLLIHNFLSPYRIPLFQELAKRFALEIWILGDIRELREWPGDAPEGAFEWRRLPHFGLGFGSRYARLVLNPSLPGELARGSWDAVIICGWDTPAAWYAARWARRRSVPLILWSGSTAVEKSLLRNLTLPLVRWFVPLADAWVAYGSRAAEYLARFGAVPERTYLAFNSVDLHRFAQDADLGSEAVNRLRSQLGIRGKHVILYCGNLIALKGLDFLLRAFAGLCAERSDVELAMVGSGSGEARYRALATELGIGDRVHWAGYVEPERVPAYYGIADLLVLPSLSEVWGLVVNEALACGVPVVVSAAAGSSADLIREGENGFIVAPGDSEALLEAFRTYFDSRTDRMAMRGAARASVQRYSIPAMADAFEHAVETAIGIHR